MKHAQFKSGAQFGAWLAQAAFHGGKSNLGTITKLLAHPADSGRQVRGQHRHTRGDPIPRWVLALKVRSGWQKAVVALANKNARIL